MTTQLGTSRLVDGIHDLWNRFKDELSGPRQATRTQMVRYLARRLGISEPAAGRLFADLEHAGVILRRDERLEDLGNLPRSLEGVEQRWAIDPARSDGAATHLDSLIPATDDQEPDLKAIELLRGAIRRRATDIHLDPFGDEIEIRFRVDGRLEHYRRLDTTVGRLLMGQFKILANMDPVEPFHAHEGRLRLPLDLHEFDVRITTVPVATGEAVALRLLSRDQIIRPLSELGFSEVGTRRVKDSLRSAEGVVLVAGPSGAGKTTTLYSLVHDLDDGRRNIVTIEDPVEYVVPQFLQIEVDPRHGRTPAGGLRTVLRMDADVILLGEIRDAETATAAMTAASCGKHVLATIHARDAAAAITALRQLDVDDRALASTIRGVISQRLVRRVCRKCRGSRAPTDSDREPFASAGIGVPEHLAVAVGCDECRGTGYLGRVGVFEIAPVDPDLAAAVAVGQGERELRGLLRERGIGGLQAAGLEKAAEGETTIEEVRNTGWPD